MTMQWFLTLANLLCQKSTSFMLWDVMFINLAVKTHDYPVRYISSLGTSQQLILKSHLSLRQLDYLNTYDSIFGNLFLRNHPSINSWQPQDLELHVWHSGAMYRRDCASPAASHLPQDEVAGFLRAGESSPACSWDSVSIHKLFGKPLARLQLSCLCCGAEASHPRRCQALNDPCGTKVK